MILSDTDKRSAVSGNRDIIVVIIDWCLGAALVIYCLLIGYATIDYVRTVDQHGFGFEGVAFSIRRRSPISGL